MPKVKYLKDLCSGEAGTVHDLQDYEVNVLIQLGLAEYFDGSEISEASSLAKAEADRLLAEQEYEQIPPNILLNLNGTPVVSDFGDLIEQSEQSEQLSEAEKPKKKGSKTSK